ncbi:TolC family protein [Geomonas sp. Red32]|uniref:TolC family protein n=1 Tax=Geomonas sp. Red32 TaxID=2912856 RepID=UPI00202CBFD3|nr:TolC family protein [Geomonas sp. Red32]MCM0083571.1 TolC family protein [Geomonas sp. Red32]
MNPRSTISLTLLFSSLIIQPVMAEGNLAAEKLPPLIDQALANNPDLKSSDARWRAFESRIVQARAFDDPMLMLKIQNGLVNDPLNLSKDSMTQKVIGISQQLPYFGKRDLKAEMAAKEADSYRWQVDERKLELRRMVSEAYYQIYFTDRAAAIVDRNIKLMDDFVALAENKYSVGQGAQQDIFKAQVERSKMLDMRITLDQQRKTLQANLNALLYRPADTPVGAVPDFDIKPPALTAEQLKAMAFDNRPLLKSLKAQIEKSEAGVKLARKESYPDFNVSFEYMQRDPAMGSNGDDMYSLGVTFNLPVRKERRQAMVAEASSEVNMSTEDLRAARNTIEAGIADLLAQMERRRKLIDLYKTGIIPQAEQALESATIGYRVNKVDFLTLLDSRVTLFNYERELYDSMADYQMKQAQLEALVGKSLQ